MLFPRCIVRVDNQELASSQGRGARWKGISNRGPVTAAPLRFHGCTPLCQRFLGRAIQPIVKGAGSPSMCPRGSRQPAAPCLPPAPRRRHILRIPFSQRHGSAHVRQARLAVREPASREAGDVGDSVTCAPPAGVGRFGRAALGSAGVFTTARAQRTARRPAGFLSTWARKPPSGIG